MDSLIYDTAHVQHKLNKTCSPTKFRNISYVVNLNNNIFNTGNYEGYLNAK